MTSFDFLVFFFAFLAPVILIYHFAHQRLRWIVLLTASYVFFIINSGILVIYLLASTVTVFFAAHLLEKLDEKCEAASAAAEKGEKKAVRSEFVKKKRWIVFAALAINFGFIIHLKYSAFFNSSINDLFGVIGVSAVLPVSRYVLPLGISFYTMTAASYVIDVYRGSIRAERSLPKLALFFCFFPQILEGPICRYSETAQQLYSGRNIEYKNLCFGLQRVAFGMLKRMLVADRVNNYVNYVFSFYNIYNYSALEIVVATLCYSFQIYMDFSGTMDIVLGIAEVFGVTLPENFKRPFFSRTISEFWTRWHITLGKWFSDYVFYPVSMSKPMKALSRNARKKLGNHYGPLASGAIALFLVWLCNGLWHGSGWQYLFFGMYHFSIILAGSLTEPIWRVTAEKLRINRESKVYHLLQIVRTVLLFNLGEMFFRASSLKDGFAMLGRMVHEFSLTPLFDGTLFKTWLDGRDYILLIVTAVALVIHGVRAERGHNVREEIAALNPVARYSVYAALIMLALIFGGYGFGYSYVEPIYANF